MVRVGLQLLSPTASPWRAAYRWRSLDEGQAIRELCRGAEICSVHSL